MLLPVLNQGELAVLYCFVFLYFVFPGAGAWTQRYEVKRVNGEPWREGGHEWRSFLLGNGFVAVGG